jgi:hypothetical protein
MSEQLEGKNNKFNIYTATDVFKNEEISGKKIEDLKNRIYQFFRNQNLVDNNDVLNVEGYLLLKCIAELSVFVK